MPSAQSGILLARTSREPKLAYTRMNTSAWSYVDRLIEIANSPYAARPAGAVGTVVLSTDVVAVPNMMARSVEEAFHHESKFIVVMPSHIAGFTVYGVEEMP